MATRQKEPKATKQYDKPLEQWLKEMVDRIRGAYRSFDPVLQAGEYTGAIKRMAEEFGRDRANAAITKAIDMGGGKDASWVPSIGEIRRQVPPASGERKRCKACIDNEGFVFVELEVRGKMERRAKRCTHEAA